MTFIAGMFVGAILGIFVIALVSANSKFKEDDDYERFDREN